MPKFSIIIPTFQRAGPLGECLACLEGQAAPAGVEVIVANDGDPLPEEFARRFSWVRFVAGPRRGPAANRNCGAKAAGGDWLAFLDDDCVPQPGWLAGFQAAAQGGRDLLEGRVEATGWTGHPLDERVENLRGGVFWSCNLAVRRSLFESCGGFDEDFQQAAFEDMELAERLRRLGARTAFVNEAHVRHPVRRLTLGQLWRRTLMTRWYALFLRKTLPNPNAASVAAVLTLNLARGLARKAREIDSSQWQRALFLAGWELATFPVLLPYVCFWDMRHGRLRSKHG